MYFHGHGMQIIKGIISLRHELTVLTVVVVLIFNYNGMGKIMTDQSGIRTRAHCISSLPTELSGAGIRTGLIDTDRTFHQTFIGSASRLKTLYYIERGYDF